MKRKLLTTLISLLTTISISVGCSFAWFSEIVKLNINNLTGQIYTGYFYSGTGTEEDPYTITRPIHYKNMIDLIDYDDEFASKYYQIGYDLDEDGDLEVFEYNDSGYSTGDYSETLNMKGFDITPITIFNGELNGSDLTVSNLSISTENCSDLGVFGYVTEDACIHNIYFDNITINTSSLALNTEHTETAHCGYLAGHIEKAQCFENVYINHCSLLGHANTAIRNDWGYFGYCENAKSLQEFVARAKGEEAGWGGSIGMDEVHSRLESFRNSTIKTQVKLPQEKTGEYHYYSNGVEDLTKYKDIISDSENVTSYEYFNETSPLQGRVVFGQQQGNYLWGKRVHNRDYTITNEYHNDNDKVCYYLKSGNYYFRGTGSTGRINDEAQKTLLFEDSDGWIYYNYNNKTYYLYASSSTNGTLRTSTSKQTYMFKVDADNLRLYKVSDNTPYERYIRYSGSSFSISNTKSNILIQTTDYKIETVVDHQISHYTHGTYLPLNIYKTADEITDADLEKYSSENLVVNGAKPNNTGYIVGGTKDMSDNYGSGVRIASNYDYSDISRALGGSSTYTSNNLQILTRTKNTDSVVFIEDSYNKDTALSTNLKNLTYASDVKYSVEDLDLQMYTKSRFNLDKQFNANTSTLYCMRFNEFDISLDNTIVAEKVMLNGEIKENYTLPESCVDFNLKEKGYINFFGGGYRGGTCDAFFSLYHIIRDDSDELIELKRLSKIYGTDNKKDPYIYEYVDGSYSIYNPETKTYISTTLSEGYTMQFDLKWVEEPGFTAVDNTVWYFEIPVNEGEYALGSAINSRTSTGGYIFYLDVASNGEIDENDTVDTFGSVEYRNAKNVVENSICLITYVQEQGNDVTLETYFEGNTYYITMTNTKSMEVQITLLNKDYKIKFNNTIIENVIKTTLIVI